MIKIGFALLSAMENPIPSTRIACLNLFPLLRQAGYEPIVVFEPSTPSADPDVGNLVELAVAAGVAAVVFQKIHGPSVLKAVAGLRAATIGSIYCVCDWVDNEMAAAVDATIVISEYMKSLYRPALHSRIFVVHDGLERPQVVRRQVRKGDERLEAVLVTSHALYRPPVIGIPPAGWGVNVIGDFFPAACSWKRFQAAKWTLARCSGYADRVELLAAMLHPRLIYTAWDQEGVYDGLASADIGILPIDVSDKVIPAEAPVPFWMLKSENRLTLNMAVGLPVIATPIPSYECVIEHGVNGFFARSRRDWLDCFARLRDPDLRHEIGKRARQSVIQRYSLEAQAVKFLQVVCFVLMPAAEDSEVFALLE